MEFRASPVQNDTPYVSACSSPAKFNLNNVYFYSLPSSPWLSGAPSPCDSPKTSITYEDVSYGFGDFEFATSPFLDLDGFEYDKSQTFEHLSDHGQLQQDSQPAMAFADQLFCNGQVLPLKLPPRLQTINSSKSCNPSSTTSPPRSPRSVFKLPFLHKNLWNDDYDPFMVALENVTVKQEGLGRSSHHKRCRSLSPVRTSDESINPGQSMKQNESAYESWLQFPEKAMESSKLGGEESCTVETRKQRIKAFLFKSASVSQGISRVKPRNQTEALWKPPLDSKGWSFRKSFAAVHTCGKRKVYKEMKAIIQYRPRLFLCFGLRHRRRRNIN